MPRRPARHAVLTALVLTASLLAVLPSASAEDERPAAGTREAVARVVEEARSAVSRVDDIVDGKRSGDLTMALRDVALTRNALSGSDREAADALLRRPTSSGGGDGIVDYGGVPERTPTCTPDLCVHSVASGPHAATTDYVAEVVAVLTRVHDVYAAAGYREPKADGGGARYGGNSKLDVYLGETGQQLIYGYCTSDDPTTNRYYDRWAYCTLDNDYAEFTRNTPSENLRVTAAHEYFHAVQYGYDIGEDSWLLEATATWAEDEFFDGVDDNLQFLRASQMRKPGTPLDTFDPQTGFHYGTWSFFRFLTERYPGRKGALPRLVLDIFRKADGARGGPDQYSWQAVNTVLRAKKTTGRRMLAAYAAANRRPGVRYSEGRANRYPIAPLAYRKEVGKRTVARFEKRMRHLTTATARLTPSGLGKGWKLRLALDLGPKATGPVALVTSFPVSGRPKTQAVKLGANGNAVKKIPFNRTVKYVEVTLVNGSGRFDCFQRPPTVYSCAGKPKDDRVVQGFTARAVR